MAPGSARWWWLPLVVLGAIAAGCGDDPGPPPAGVRLHPVPGCEAIDPSPCDVFVASCQTKLMELAACLRGSSPQALPPVSRMTEAEYAQLLTDMLAEEPPPNLGHYEGALVMLGLVVPGAFQPGSMAAARAAGVLGFYRPDLGDIVLIDRGRPGDDADANRVLLHELVHALQDRDQDLTTWYDAHADTYDAALAAMSVVEGEARLHEERFGVSLLGLDPNTVDLARHFDSTVRLVEQWVPTQPSPYLASYSAFPYEFGARRLLPRFMQGGPQAIAELFSAPPAGTRPLLDPGNDGALPAWVAPAPPAPPPEWVLTHETTLGAWATYLFLVETDSTAGAHLLALGWRGDRLSVYAGTGPAGATSALVWRIAFPDAAAATRAAQQVTSRFAVQIAGAELVIAASDSALAVDWAFAVPAQNAPAPGDDEIARAPDSSASDWLNRIFMRAGRSR